MVRLHSVKRRREASVPILAIATRLWLINARQDAIDAVGCRSRLHASNILVCLFHHSLPTQSFLPASLLVHDQVFSCIGGFALEVASKARDPKFRTFEVACLKIFTTMTRYSTTLYGHHLKCSSISVQQVREL